MYLLLVWYESFMLLVCCGFLEFVVMPKKIMFSEGVYGFYVICMSVHLFVHSSGGGGVQSIVSLTSSLRGQLVKCFIAL